MNYQIDILPVKFNFSNVLARNIGTVFRESMSFSQFFRAKTGKKEYLRGQVILLHSRDSRTWSVQFGRLKKPTVLLHEHFRPLYFGAGFVHERVLVE